MILTISLILIHHGRNKNDSANRFFFRNEYYATPVEIHQLDHENILIDLQTFILLASSRTVSSTASQLQLPNVD